MFFDVDIDLPGGGFDDVFNDMAEALDVSDVSLEDLIDVGDGPVKELTDQLGGIAEETLVAAKEEGLAFVTSATNNVSSAQSLFDQASAAGDAFGIDQAQTILAEAKDKLVDAIADSDKLIANAIAYAKDNTLGYISNMPSLLGGLVQTISDTAISQLYNNPMAAVLTSSGLVIDNLTAKVLELSTMTITVPLDLLDPDYLNLVQLQSDALAFISTGSLAGLSTSMGNFATHTGKLAGTIANLSPSAPGLNSILSVGSQMRTASQLLGGAGDCLQMVGSMTGLFAGGPLTAASSILSSSFDQLNRGINVFATLAGQVSAMKNLVDTVMSKDAQFLQNSIARLKQVATASILASVASDPCGKFVLTQVGSAGLLQKIPGM